MNKCMVLSVKKDLSGEPRTTCYGGIEWELFMDHYMIPRKYNTIRFSQISQSEEFIQKMCDFVDVPDGIMIMRGPPGTGKTFASIAMCEKFTRMDSGCAYYTIHRLNKKWLESIQEHATRFEDEIFSQKLLVIDDLGASEISPAFASFFYSIIEYRMNDEGKGTIITTNLTNEAFMELFGATLCDRLFTAQFLEFSGNSRRKKTI